MPACFYGQLLALLGALLKDVRLACCVLQCEAMRLCRRALVACRLPSVPSGKAAHGPALPHPASRAGCWERLAHLLVRECWSAHADGGGQDQSCNEIFHGFAS